jgi:hypothetical protein
MIKHLVILVLIILILIISCILILNLKLNSKVENFQTKTDIIDNETYNNFKQNWESTNFVLGAIPEDKKITISWKENLKESDVDSYIIYIFEKKKVGQVLTQKISHTDIVKNQNNKNSIINCIYIINDLYNNIQYGIQLNKISKQFKNYPRLVKTSNTIYAVPSEINLLNFNSINNNNEKKCESYSENLLNNFVGREFEINLG